MTLDLTAQDRRDALNLVLRGLLVLTPILLYVLWQSQLTSCGGRDFEDDAIYALKALHTGQTRFRREDWDRDGKPDYASLSELDSCGVAEVKFGEFRARQGYLFEVWRNAGPGHVWWGKASPAVLGTTGDRYFYVDREGAIYFSLVDLSLPLRTEEVGDKLALLGS
tara:strand:- start:220 stop:717 length:498 start_codon:yes stop_codon:yes gene_type:complete